MNKTDILGAIMGLFGGLVLIDVDHFTLYPIFHYMGTVMFFFFIAIILIIKMRDEK
jgi:hypothetical protein